MTKRMATAVAALLALAACGGGGVGTSSPTQPLTPAAPQSPAAPQAKTAKLAVAFTLPKRVALKSAKVHVKDINTDVTDLDVIYPNSGIAGDTATTTDHFILLTGPSCTNPSPGTFSCTIAVPASASPSGYGVQVNTDDGGTVTSNALGVTTSQTLAFTAGNTTSANFTITPIVQSVISLAHNPRLPADNNANSGAITTAALDPDGAIIADPVVDAVFGLNAMFGSIHIGANTADIFNLVGTPFNDPGPTGLLSTSFMFTGPEDDTDFVPSFTLTPNYAAGGAFDFFANQVGTFPGNPTAATTFVATIAQSGPTTGGTGNDVTYSGSTTATRQGDAAQTLNFAAADTFNGLTVTEFNAGAGTTGSITSPGSFIDESNTCISDGITILPTATTPAVADPLFATFDISQGYTISATANATSCVATFTTSDWGANSIVTTLTITGPASLNATVNGHSQKAALIKK